MKRGGNLKRDTPGAKSWLQRSKLATSLRSARLKKRGRNFKAKRKRDFGERAIEIRRMPCLVCGATPSDSHHEPPRSLGGTSKDQIPLCRRHHRVRHDIGPTRFYTRYEIDLKAWRDTA